MMRRPLMPADELKTLPKGHFILAKTECCSMQTELPLFFKRRIRFGEPYEVPEQAAMPVACADWFELEQVSAEYIVKPERKTSNRSNGGNFLARLMAGQEALDGQPMCREEQNLTYKQA